jgi:signal transduction histidine kinase
MPYTVARHRPGRHRPPEIPRTADAAAARAPYAALMLAEPRLPAAQRLSGPIGWAGAAAYAAGGWMLFAHKVHPGWLGALIALGSGLPVALGRARPAPALALAVSVFWLSAGPPTAGFLALAPTAYVLWRIAATARPGPAAAALALALTGPVATALPDPHSAGAVLPFAFVLLVAWMIGSVTGQNQRYAEERLRHGVAGERLRLARELHDVVAHGMSVITVQAAYGRLIVGERPDAAAASLAHIETTGRQTLDELRRLLDVLRGDDPAGDDTAGPDAAGPLEPAPGLADLGRLVDHAGAAGVRVALTVAGPARPLPAGVELCAYRVVQEALTNVVKHAGTDTASARVDYRPDGLVVEVTDGGRGGPVTAGGHGLAGMRERVALYHGTLDAGPGPVTGFRVCAHLPAAGP